MRQQSLFFKDTNRADKNINIGIANPPEWTLQLTEVKDEDAKRGFELYSLLVFCPGEAAKLYKFLANLINGEKGATILRSTINTLVANQLTEEKSKHGLISFYHELDHLFNHQF